MHNKQNQTIIRFKIKFDYLESLRLEQLQNENRRLSNQTPN